MPEGKGLTWVPSGEESGHKWERGLHNGLLVAIRCANCGEIPMNVMRADHSVEPCHPTTALRLRVSGYKDLIERVNRKIDPGGVLQFEHVRDALEHMTNTVDAVVLCTAVSRESGQHLLDQVVVQANDRWGGAARVDRARLRVDWSRATLRIVTPESERFLDEINPTAVLW